MNDLIAASAIMQTHAYRILQESRLADIWQSRGASVHIVGSLRMGLLMKHRDIDLHIYSHDFSLTDSFDAMAAFAANPSVGKITCLNLLKEQDNCVQWQAEYNDVLSGQWQIDIIHMPEGARYAGYFEQMAERIKTALTQETRYAILSLKHQTPDCEKIMGIEYYQAVLRDGVRTWRDFVVWRQQHPMEGIIEWMP